MTILSYSHKTTLDAVFGECLHQWLCLIRFSRLTVDESRTDASLLHFAKSVGDDHVVVFVQARTRSGCLL